MRSIPVPVSQAAKIMVFLALAVSVASPAAGKDSWVEVRSPHFTVLSNSGEKGARRIADQFEQFREVFHVYLPSLRVDLGKPLVILAVKNEDGLKLLLPGYWEVKGHTHPAGLYAPGEESHFVAVRTNIEGEMPYEVVYHEYTHAIINLNFDNVPVWLNEGLAEFFGNSTIQEKEVQIGHISRGHLLAIQQSRLIPIEALLTADHHSPYYNEGNRATVFYAESWAIVHYLMMDPEARKRQLLNNFLKTWQETGDQVKAAQMTFGDLKKFSGAMEAYSRQPEFYYQKIATAIHGDAKSYSSRDLPPAELAAYRSMFYLHTQRPNEAKSSAEEAVQADPKLPLAYEARGLLAFTQHDFPAAETDFSRAIELNSSSYFAYFFAAQALVRRGLPSSEDREKVIALLEKTVVMNPQFAPGYSSLASVYSMRPETYQKAIDSGVKAVKLEPGNLNYVVSLGYVLLNCGKTADAKALVKRIQQAATTPQDKAAADALAANLATRENYDRENAEYAARSKRDAEGRQNASNSVTVSIAAPVDPASGTPATHAPAKHDPEQELAVEGIIAFAECNQDSQGKLTLTVNHVGIKFTYSSLKGLQTVGGPKDAEAPACAEWKGKKVRLYFYQAKNKSYAGELETIQFF